MFRPVEEKSGSFIFLEYQQDALQSFHEFGMDWYRFWNTLNLKPDICIAQVMKNPLRILNLMTILVLPWDFPWKIDSLY